MSKELIDRLKSYIPSGDGHNSQYANDLADAVAILEAKAAPVGEREAFEAHMRIGGYSNPDKHPDGSYVSSAMELWWQGWKARAAYQRAQQPQSAEAVAYVLTRDGEVCYEADDGIVISNTPGDETDLYKWQPVYFTTPQPSAVPDGWKLVPVEPTPEMMKAGCAVPLNKAARHNSCYRAMLAAAPSAPKADDPVKVQLLEALEELMYACTDKAEALATAAIAAARKEGGKV